MCVSVHVCMHVCMHVSVCMFVCVSAYSTFCTLIYVIFRSPPPPAFPSPHLSPCPSLPLSAQHLQIDGERDGPRR